MLKISEEVYRAFAVESANRFKKELIDKLESSISGSEANELFNEALRYNITVESDIELFFKLTLSGKYNVEGYPDWAKTILNDNTIDGSLKISKLFIKFESESKGRV